MNESRFKCSVVNLLRKELPSAWVYHPSDRFVSGIPDLLIVWRGRMTAIELKVGKNRASKIQVFTLQKIQEAGCITAVCWNLSEVREVIKKIWASVNGVVGK